MAKLFAIEKSAVLNDKGCMSEPDEIDAQLKLIAKMLVEARAPLIYGLTQLTVEAQELAVELAMCLRGAIDTPRGSHIPARGTSLQLHGEARTTLGELRQYADVLVFVGCEPTPKFRTLFAVDGTPEWPAKKVYALPFLGSDTLWHELGCRNSEEVQVLRKKRNATTPRDPKHEELLAAWQTAKYPVLIYEPTKLAKSFCVNAASYLLEQLERAALVRAKFGRAAAWPIELSDGLLSNAAGAEYVLTARTGYPAAVQCYSGRAEFMPGVTNAEALLADGVIDAALFLGEGPSAAWTNAALQHLQNIPTAIIASKEAMQGRVCKHQIACCALGEVGGTIVREDGVPTMCRPSSASRNTHAPDASSLLYRLLELVREPAAAASGAAR